MKAGLLEPMYTQRRYNTVIVKSLAPKVAYCTLNSPIDYLGRNHQILRTYPLCV